MSRAQAAVAFGYGLPETLVAASYLRAYGVHVAMDSRETVSVAWHWTHALGGIALRVPASQAGLAAALLADAAAVAVDEPPPRFRPWMFLLHLVVCWFWAVPPPSRGLYLAQAPEGASMTE